MASKASIGGHPIHPILIPFPIALWSTSFAVDLCFYFLRYPGFVVISKFLIAAGCLGALAAAVPGIIDWLAIKDPQVNKIANWHARLNIIALVIFGVSLYLRMHVGSHWVGGHLTIPFLLSLLGVVLIGISGWLGGELAYKYGVGVAPQHDSPEQEVAKVRFR